VGLNQSKSTPSLIGLAQRMEVMSAIK